MADLSGWQKALYRVRPQLEEKVKIEHIISSSREEQDIVSQSSDFRRVRKLVDILLTKDEKALKHLLPF